MKLSKLSLVELKIISNAIEVQFDVENDCVLEDLWSLKTDCVEGVTRDHLNDLIKRTNDKIDSLVSTTILREKIRAELDK